MSCSLLSDLQQRAAARGLNLFGAVDATRYDTGEPTEARAQSLLPGCGTVLVVGSGGSEFWRTMVAVCGAPQPPAPGYHPVQTYAVGALAELQALLQAHGVRSRAVQPEDRQTLCFQRLAEAAGFGTISPVVGILLHPRFGPWVSLRGAILCEGQPFGTVPDASIVDSFQPCCRCNKPCVNACTAAVYDGTGNADFFRCATHRHVGNCTSGCNARRACPVGAEHRYGPQEESHRHAYSLFAMQRWFGLGAWRFVPRFLRR